MKNVQPLLKRVTNFKKLQRERSNFENTTAGEKQTDTTSILQITLVNGADLAPHARPRSHARTKRNDFPVGAATLSPPNLRSYQLLRKLEFLE